MDEDPHAALIAGLRSNEEWAAAEVVRRYGTQLRRIADHRMQSRLKRRLDADDILQSAFRTSFAVHARGQLVVDDTVRLWNLLCAITLNKVREKSRFHLQDKRGLYQEHDAEHAVNGHTQAVPEQSIYAEVDFADEFQHLTSSFDDEELQIVVLKLDDRTHQEVAEQMRISQRTVSRILKRVQLRLESMLD